MTKEIEVRKGYKKTKVGVIPEEWEVERLSSIFSHFKSGLGITSNNISNMGEFPVFGGNGLRGFTNSYTHNGSYILIGRQGALCGNIRFASGQIYISEHAIAAQTNDLNDLQYFKYKLEYKKLNRLSESSAQPGLSVIKLLRVKLDVPPLAEQQKIATILTTWDKAIENVQLVIDNLKVRNKGLAQQLLTGKKRLKGFEGEWKKYTLNDIAIRVKRRNSELNDNVITISAQRGFVLQEEFFNKRVASATLSNYYLLVQGEFAYNKSYSKGYPMGAFKRLNNLNKAVVTTLYICFKLKANVNSNFMEQFFEAGLMTKNLMRIAQEGGRAHGLLNIGLSDFFNLKLIIPSLKEQHAISKILEEANQELKLYEKKLVTLQEQKKGLMQKLLTGEIRVKTEKL